MKNLSFLFFSFYTIASFIHRHFFYDQLGATWPGIFPFQSRDRCIISRTKRKDLKPYFLIVKVWCKQEHHINFLVIKCAYYYVWLRDREQKHTYVRNMSNTPKRGLKQRTTTKRKIIKDLIARAILETKGW